MPQTGSILSKMVRLHLCCVFVTLMWFDSAVLVFTACSTVLFISISVKCNSTLFFINWEYVRIITKTTPISQHFTCMMSKLQYPSQTEHMTFFFLNI